MSVTQAWLLVGVPALVLGLAAFIGRSWWRSLLGYAVLLVGFGVMAVVDRASGAAFGGLLALLYAAGRGGRMESEHDPVADAPRTAAEGSGP